MVGYVVLSYISSRIQKMHWIYIYRSISINRYLYIDKYLYIKLFIYVSITLQTEVVENPNYYLVQTSHLTIKCIDLGY